MRVQDWETKQNGPVIAPTDGSQDQLCTSLCRQLGIQSQEQGRQIGRAPVLLEFMFLLVEGDR